MKPKKKVIDIILHKPTGAKVPVVVRKVDDDKVVTDFSEYTEQRRGFTVAMLELRWSKPFMKVLELLKKFQVPAYLTHESLKSLKIGELPAVKAIFFEEYIYGIEHKTELPHKKLKARDLKELLGK